MPNLLGSSARRAGIRFSLACDLAAIRPATLAIRAFLEAQGVCAEDLAACELALAEACNNAVQYVSPSRRDRPILAEALVDPVAIELRVEDSTDGFELPEITELPQDEEESGRGLYLIKSLMGSLRYLRSRTGNCMVMTRSRSGALPEALVPDPYLQLQDLHRRLEEDERVIRDMADELGSCYESLSAIFRYSTEQTRSMGLHDFSRRILDDMLRVTGMEWYVFRLAVPARDSLDVFAASSPELDTGAIALPSALQASDPIEVRAALNRQDAWFDQPQQVAADDPLARVWRGTVGLVHPVCLADELIGTLATGGANPGTRLTAARISIIHTLVDFLAIQIVNARYHDERVQNLLVSRELEIAEHIQRSLLPTSIPQVPGIEVAGYCESARQVGGDFYDVIPLSATQTLLLVSDVMGKGIPAAMFAVILRTLVRALRDSGPRPGQLLHRANELIYRELSEVEMFVTAQLAFVDAERREVVLASAGHCPALFRSPRSPSIQVLSPEGLPLGVVSDAEFAEERFWLDPGSSLILYTDGITEAANADGMMLGQSRLAEWVGRLPAVGADATSIRELLLRELNQFQTGTVLRDDQTFLVMAG